MPAAIDPEQIPGRDLDPEAIETNAATVTSLAGTVRDTGSQVQLSWQRMAGVYEAPESATLLGLMDPVSSQATASGDGIETVGGALTAFAADVRPIKAELDALRLEAQTFAAEISGGVSVRELNPAWVSTQGYQGSWNAYGAYSSSSTGGTATATEVSQYRTVTKEWHEVQEYVDRNNDLIARVNAQQVLLWEAERTCANAIRALYCAAPLRAATSEDDALAYGIDEIPAGTEMPWGAEVERTEGCGEATVNVVFKDFLWEGIAVGGVWGTVEGLGTLVLGYDPSTGDFFSGDAYGAAWGSLGSLALSGVIAATPPLNVLFAVDDGMRQFGGDGFLPDEVAEFKDGLDETAKNTGKALIAWDKWADDPGTALGESVFNVGTILIPGSAAVAGVKTAGTAASVLSKMARFTDLIDPGAWAVNGAVRVGGHAFSGVGDLAARLDSPTFSGLDVVDLGDDLGQPAVLRADTGQTAMTALVDELGIDPDAIVARVDDGVPVLEAPGVRVELPEGAFGDAAQVGDDVGPVRPDDSAAEGHADSGSGSAVDGAHDDSAVDDVARDGDADGADQDVRSDQGADGGVTDRSDEGWTSTEDESLSLSPDERAAVDDFLAGSHGAEPRITTDVTGILGTRPGVQMEGLDFRLKGDESMYRKVATALDSAAAGSDVSVSGVLANVKDSIRYTATVPHDGFASTVRSSLDDMIDAGYQPYGDFKNSWGREGYQGINSTWFDPVSGRVFEVQFHTEASFAAKMETHDLYELERLPGQSPEVVEDLRAQQQEIFDRVETPQGAADLTWPDDAFVVERAPGTSPSIIDTTDVGARVTPEQIERLRSDGWMVAFFDEKASTSYYAGPADTLGASGRPFFVMPAEDAGIVHNAHDAARYTGMSPATQAAYLNGENVHGLAFPTDGVGIRPPHAADAMGWPHFLEGGHTAVLGEGPDAGFLLNPTREFVIEGGRPVMPSAFRFELVDGEWFVRRVW